MTEVVEGQVMHAGEWTPQEAADYVAEPWQAAVGSIVETGRRLSEAKERVGHGKWMDAVALMPFGDRTAQRLILIARHPDLADPTHVSDLPPSWGTLAILAQLPEGEVTKRIEAGEITPELDRATAQSWVSTYSAARQEALNAWNQFNDSLTAALSYAKTYEPPDDTDIYATVADVQQRANELAVITATWKDTE